MPGYLAEPSSDARWCHLWLEYPVAVARLHAAWLAWQELTDPATCGYTGPTSTPACESCAPPAVPAPEAPSANTKVIHRMPGLAPSAWRTADG
ncbi:MULTISPECIES: DUF4913 domain-containing protein [unclassified Streptomyces]|uniref:DUF4913 domain-containing protein n=1 Tax=unclassified Streptomyces TaxID=2593676 RepID=UPI00210AD1C4|nr:MULTISPECIES: DUF4913 domain-containing protein [unclassified Streptomyces]